MKICCAQGSIYVREDFSHSKTIIIDDELVSVGSGIFDFRSFENNFETNAHIYDPKIVGDIMKEFDRITYTIEGLVYDDYKNRPWTRRLKEGFAKLFSLLLSLKSIEYYYHLSLFLNGLALLHPMVFVG